MTTEDRDDKDFNQSTSEGDTVSHADRAIRDTAQKYLDRAGVKIDLRQIEKSIREQPVRSAAIAVAAGSSSVAAWLHAWAWQRSLYLVARLLERRRPISSVEDFRRALDGSRPPVAVEL